MNLTLTNNTGNSHLIVQPEEVRAVIGGSAMFRCFLASSNSIITDIKWIVNDSLLEEHLLIGVTSNQSLFSDGNRIGSLLFTNLTTQYNMSRIQCRAELSMPQATSTTDPAILIISETGESHAGSLYAIV